MCVCARAQARVYDCACVLMVVHMQNETPMDVKACHAVLDFDHADSGDWTQLPCLVENIFTIVKFCLPWPFFFSVILPECSRHYKLFQESQLYPVCPWLLALKCKIHTLCSLMILPPIHPLDSTFFLIPCFPLQIVTTSQCPIYAVVHTAFCSNSP